MPESDASLEHRVEELARKVEVLAEEFASLSAQVEGLSGATSEAPPLPSRQAGEPVAVHTTSQDQNISTVLSTVATVSFLMVVALVLRTVVDNGVIDRRLGSYLGIFYAGLLVANSFWRYSRGHPHVPVYSTCGAMLIFSIVFESLTRFNTLSAPTAYTILGATLIAMSVLGLRYAIPTAIVVGSIGASLVGVALEFPNSHFAWLAGLILMANLVSHYARRIPECAWLRWATLLIALFFWSLWTVKIRAELLQDRTPPATMAITWLLPCLGLFAALYIAMTFRTVLRPKHAFLAFERILPVVNVVLGYLVASRVAAAGWGNSSTVAAVAGMAAPLHIAFAHWSARRGESGARAATSFTLAAAALLALAVPAYPGPRIVVLGTWSVSALVIGLLSGRWSNGTVRAVSYLLQYFACGAAVFAGWLAVAAPTPVDRLTTALVLACLCFLHYGWSRYQGPPPEGGLYASLDPGDRTAIGLFFVALVYGFVAARIVLYSFLSDPNVDFEATFLCGQSVLINAAALVLLFWGVRRDKGEVIAVAFVVAILGAIKVFGYDFLKIQGVELVVSVFSFGVTAGIGSLVWRRRQLGADSSTS